MTGCKFKLEQEQFVPEVTVNQYQTSSKKITFRCKMKQIPANNNGATTGHKLQGMSKDAIIVSSWPTGGLAAMFKNWEYVVLSRVRTLSGLYLVKPIDMDKSFKPSPQTNSIHGQNKKNQERHAEKTQIRNIQNILVIALTPLVARRYLQANRHTSFGGIFLNGIVRLFLFVIRL